MKVLTKTISKSELASLMLLLAESVAEKLGQESSTIACTDVIQHIISDIQEDNLVYEVEAVKGGDFVC